MPNSQIKTDSIQGFMCTNALLDSLVKIMALSKRNIWWQVIPIQCARQIRGKWDSNIERIWQSGGGRILVQ